MSENRDPLAPFVFHEDEAFVGEGPLLRTRRRRALTIALVVLLVLAAVAFVQVPRLIAARGLDLARNAETGLADGTYLLEPIASMHEGDRCWFRGPVRGLTEGGEVTVVGRGVLQCAGPQDYVGRVTVTVVNGRATITDVSGY